MSRLKGRIRRGDWKQAQNRNALNHEALSLPSSNSRPFLLHSQLQIALTWLQVSEPLQRVVGKLEATK